MGNCKCKYADVSSLCKWRPPRMSEDRLYRGSSGAVRLQDLVMQFLLQWVLGKISFCILCDLKYACFMTSTTYCVKLLSPSESKQLYLRASAVLPLAYPILLKEWGASLLSNDSCSFCASQVKFMGVNIIFWASRYYLLNSREQKLKYKTPKTWYKYAFQF